ncbi:RelA/SpoT domain-containing protein [Thermoclostridium stercorarium subsp. stercorarium DSM 8532]|uniref:RelA/SpoT domain-containing protein n=2 Tax=Thermoclostridium stercorarium TaxID=1510 RepID=L7VR23_THES1|nr:GTP pyrophosphokinase family protein [Thermoclostridium stercorarium]AGC69237.1 RelA/SpoT domain-containing protein [Thermoclostridium stercorarium subsp. stercorarium DSM 8532]AGI40208.1 hypothetical protein Clst_2182 [Thermoclostridium stercorarium subsp. stercorarium DSM 8532]ANW99511.1 GTP pyrophosphokinase [Thermoclostridium stercorarium subsp. thermolacticum DSM 2910]
MLKRKRQSNTQLVVAGRQVDIADQIQDFLELRQLYNAAMRKVKTKVEILGEEFQVRYNHNPIHHIECRLKTPQSIIEKLNRKGYELSLESIRKNIMDIAGIRVICNYIDDIYTIADLLLKQDDVALVRKRDYIANPKENGYRSLHLVVVTPVFLSDRKEHVPVEVQIRTIAMDCWASLEHNLIYKSSRPLPDNIKEQLKECADAVNAIDMKIRDIYRQLWQL